MNLKPSDIKSRMVPYMNTKKKHLMLCLVWMNGPEWIDRREWIGMGWNELCKVKWYNIKSDKWIIIIIFDMGANR